MDFNKLYKKIAALDQGRQVLNESEQPVEECGMMGMSPLGGMDERPTTMSVNMNASGAEGIRELLNILQGRGDDMPGGDNSPDASLAGVLVGVDGQEHGDDMGPDSDMDHGMPDKKPMFGKEPDMDEEYANTPQPEMSGMDAVLSTGDDMNSKGREAPKVNGGGNPLAETLKGKLVNLYKEVKTR
ncbi:hypothetical protein EB118_18415 [bacterium]|nr:hypothetical protein [Actinomycetota bacterium]NDG32035.1 hypothetical protein [bacterium]